VDERKEGLLFAHYPTLEYDHTKLGQRPRLNPTIFTKLISSYSFKLFPYSYLATVSKYMYSTIQPSTNTEQKQNLLRFYHDYAHFDGVRRRL
jgi:hypothetical protein